MRYLFAFLLLVSSACGQLNKPPMGSQVDWSHGLSYGLVGFWPMLEGVGVTTYDLSGNGNTGTFTADVHWVSNIAGFAVEFDGIGDQIEVLALDAIRLNKDFTVVWLATAGAIGDMVFSQTISSNERFEIHLKGSSTPNMRSSFFDGTDSNSYESNVEVDEFSFHHWAVVRFKDKTAKVYTDGVEDTVAGSFNAPSSAPTGFFLGRDGYLGQINYVSVYNRALTDGEIQQLYNDSLAMLRRDPLIQWAATRPVAGGTATQVIMIGE